MAFGFSTKGNIADLNNLGKTQFSSGTGLTDEGLGDLRQISGDYRDLIAKGGLTPALQRGYDVAQGRISDDVIRAGRSFRATLMQQAAQSGGYLSPAAQAALAKDNEVRTNENAFSARNELSMDQAHVQQAATEKLQSQILQIADMIRTTGLTREQQGLMAQIQALAAKQGDKKMALDALTSVFRTFAGGA